MINFKIKLTGVPRRTEIILILVPRFIAAFGVLLIGAAALVAALR